MLFGLGESPSLPSTPPPQDSVEFLWSLALASPPLELHDANEITHSSSALPAAFMEHMAFKVSLSGQQKPPTSDEQIDFPMLWMNVRA